MEFLRLDLSYLFFVAPLLLFVYILYIYWRKRTIKKYFQKDLFKSISSKNKYSNQMRFFLLATAILLIILTALGPRVGKEKEIIKREGVDVIFALDVSKSMLVEDVKPNRLTKGIQVLFETIKSLKGDRVGIIVYAGESYPLVPLTLDYKIVKSLLKKIDTEMVSTQGTDLSSAISLSLNYFNNDKRSKSLFILSDGEDHEKTYTSVVEKSNKKNIIINTICIGTLQGGPIPVKKRGKKIVEYKKIKNKNVISKINIDALKKIALNSKGNFIFSSSNQKIINFIKNNLDDLEKTVSGEEIYVDYKEQFQWFAGFALFLILFDFILIKK